MTADQNALHFSHFPTTEVLQRCKKTQGQGSLKASKPDRDIAHGNISASLLQSLSPRMRRVHRARLPPPQPPPEPQPTRTAPRLGGGTPSREGFPGVFPGGIPRERAGEGPPSTCHGKRGECPRASPAIPDTDPPHPASRPSLQHGVGKPPPRLASPRLSPPLPHPPLRHGHPPRPRPRSPRGAAAPLRAAVSGRAGGQRSRAGHRGPPSVAAGRAGSGTPSLRRLLLRPPRPFPPRFPATLPAAEQAQLPPRRRSSSASPGTGPGSSPRRRRGGGRGQGPAGRGGRKGGEGEQDPRSRRGFPARPLPRGCPLPAGWRRVRRPGTSLPALGGGRRTLDAAGHLSRLLLPRSRRGEHRAPGSSPASRQQDRIGDRGIRSG